MSVSVVRTDPLWIIKIMLIILLLFNIVKCIQGDIGAKVDIMGSWLKWCKDGIFLTFTLSISSSLTTFLLWQAEKWLIIHSSILIWCHLISSLSLSLLSSPYKEPLFSFFPSLFLVPLSALFYILRHPPLHLSTFISTALSLFPLHSFLSCLSFFTFFLPSFLHLLSFSSVPHSIMLLSKLLIPPKWNAELITIQLPFSLFFLSFLLLHPQTGQSEIR